MAQEKGKYMKKQYSYKDSGVDIDAGVESVNRIKKLCKSTFSTNVISGIGAFGAVFDLQGALQGFKHPVLVQSVDGVGTKLMVAGMAGNHSGVGADIVNHSANDILCQGAFPLTFLDYIAADKISPNQVEAVVSGMCAACKKLGISLVGGELAELPGMYFNNQYDLAGCITGIAEKDEIVTGKNIAVGDVVLGLASSGLHTNGYSMARKVLLEKNKIPLTRYMEDMGRTLGEELLEPHRSYVNALRSLVHEKALNGIAHITGGGFFDNPPRILPDDKKIVIKKGTWDILPIVNLIKTLGNIDERELYRTFNMGIGLMVVVAQDKADDVLRRLKSEVKTWIIGEVAEGNKTVELV